MCIRDRELSAYIIDIKLIPPNDINHILNKSIFKHILKSLDALTNIRTEKKLVHHNNGLELQSGFNATEKKNTIAR